jgi:hypothetical protein
MQTKNKKVATFISYFTWLNVYTLEDLTSGLPEAMSKNPHD